jgi:hypothetical protein
MYINEIKKQLYGGSHLHLTDKWSRPFVWTMTECDESNAIVDIMERTTCEIN